LLTQPPRVSLSPSACYSTDQKTNNQARDYEAIAAAKREGARVGLYARFLRGKVLLGTIESESELQVRKQSPVGQKREDSEYEEEHEKARKERKRRRKEGRRRVKEQQTHTTTDDSLEEVQRSQARKPRKRERMARGDSVTDSVGIKSEGLDGLDGKKGKKRRKRHNDEGDGAKK
jgi:hypothetical protein